ncbi:MAG: hypothetical protein KBD78_06090 [Oligoflexales bacterium]|nr:hypothetical protein [Oligoflexales bacterium]
MLRIIKALPLILLAGQSGCGGKKSSKNVPEVSPPFLSLGYIQELGEQPQDLSISGNYAAVALGDGGVTILGMANPANPIQVGSYKSGAFSKNVALHGNSLFLFDRGLGLSLLDIKDPTNPNVVATLSNASLGDVVFDVLATDKVSGKNQLFIASQLNGVQVFDIDEQGSLNKLAPLKDVDRVEASTSLVASGKSLFVAEANGGIAVFAHDGEAAIKKTSYFDISTKFPKARISKIAQRENIIYAAAKQAGLVVVDFNRLDEPVLIENFSSVRNVQDVAIQGSYILLLAYNSLDSDSELIFLQHDISGGSLTLLERQTLSFKPSALDAHGGFFYLLNDSGSLDVVNIRSVE